jgi:hypothetical protein
MKHYKAPWSVSLIVVSTLTTVVCFGVSCVIAWNVPGWLKLEALLPLVIVAGSVPFTIRGYTVTTDAILVHRLFWDTRLPRAGLDSVQFEPKAMRWSIRLWGNGGLFSFTGFFRNKLLGGYRAFVTDPNKTVVLRYTSRTVVISPAEPEEFVSELTTTPPPKL